ncbi:MAG: hypothetical protein NZZ41_00190 [Candidatus Dojkabacteria bacterium]|nr:hypothetical protein [Candidatus Dojkabacteria bacterium]
MSEENKKVINLLPSTYKTRFLENLFTNSFDNLFDKGNSEFLDGFIGKITSYYEKNSQNYIKEKDINRTIYQFEPIVISKNGNNENFSLFYECFLNSIKLNGGFIENQNRLFENYYYSWCPPIDIDKFMNFKEYFWLKDGPTFRYAGYKIHEYVSNGTDTIYNFDLPYINQNEIIVTVDDVLQNLGVDYVIQNRSVVFNTSPPVDSKIKIISYKIIGYEIYVSDGVNKKYKVPLICKKKEDIIVFINNILTTSGFSIVEENGEFYVIFDNPVIVGSNIEIIVYKILNVLEDILGRKHIKDINGYYYSSNMKIVFSYNVFPSVYNSGEWIIEGVGREIRLAFDGTGSSLTSGWDLFLWDSIAWDNDLFVNFYPLSALIKSDIPEYETIERTSLNNNPWSRTNRWFHYDVLTPEDRKKAIQAKRPIIEFERDLELYNYGRYFRGFVDLVINDMKDPINSFLNALNVNKINPYCISAISINSPGSGYTNLGGNGEVVCNVVGGTGTAAQVKVTLTSGQVTAVQLVTKGEYTTIPVGPVTVDTLVGGSGASFNVEYNEINTSFFIKSLVWPNSYLGESEIFYGNIKIKDGMRILVLNSNTSDKNKVFKVSGIAGLGSPNLLLETDGILTNGDPFEGEILYVKDGIFKENEFYFDGISWNISQIKNFGNPPLFQLYDADPINNYGVKLNDSVRYPNSDFNGNKIFSYAEGEGKKDKVLNKKLKYDKNGEIVFVFNLVTDRYQYSDGEIKGFYFYNKLGKTKEKDEFYNSWHRKNKKSKQNYYNRLISDVDGIKIFEVNWKINKIEEIYINGKKVNYTYLIDTNKTIINLQNLLEKNDIIEIISVYDEDSRNGNFEIPQNLSKNPNFEEVTFLSKTNYGIHFNENIQENLSTVKFVNPGQYYSKNKYRDSEKNWSFGEQIIQNEESILKASLIFSKSELNIFDSIDYLSREYNRFFNKFIQKLNYFYTENILNQLDPPGKWVEEILKELNKNKTNDFPFYRSLFGDINNFIPPSLSYLGILQTYYPIKFIDTSLQEPLEFILCHDGSLIKSFGDFRDDVILELEIFLYNSIESKFKNENLFEFSIFDVLPGKWRKTDYNMNEINSILSRYFEIWCLQNNISYRNNVTYSADNYWSFNFRNAKSTLGDVLNGSWRAIYHYYYDTDRPHLFPWEMLGFSEKPGWWDSEYGPPPYTSLNLKLWEDLRDGRIRNGPRKGIDKRFARPELLKILPVDELGNLLNPFEAKIFDNSVLSNDFSEDWKFGDYGPVENAWRRTKFYRFDLLKLLLLTKPLKSVELFWDTKNIKRIYNDKEKTNQLVNILYKSRPKHELYQVFGERNDVLGLQNIITHYLEKDSKDIKTFYGDFIRNLNVKLGYRFGSFINSEFLSVFSETYGFLPKEDINVFLYESIPFKETFYSGILVRNLGNNIFQVFGYDVLDPNFKIIKGSSSGRKKDISIFLNNNILPKKWNPNTEYNVGDYVYYENDAYKAIKAHKSSKNFEDDLNKWKLHSDTVENIFFVVNKKLDVEKEQITKFGYGSIIFGIQDLVDFIFDYERYLLREGWIFDEYVFNEETGEGVIFDFEYSVKELLKWIISEPPVNSIFAISPFSKKARFKTDFGYIKSINDYLKSRYSILNRDGSIVNTENFIIFRLNDFFEIEAKELSEVNNIYGLRLLLNSFEHAFYVNNKTIFGDIIFDPLYNQRQNRLKISTFRTKNWNGRVTSPGFIITENTIKPNFDKSADNFRRFFDLNNQVEDKKLRDYANHNIAYQSRSYLRNLILSDTSQIDFYRGLIRQKGSSNSITKILRSNYISNFANFKFYENWAFRIGEFGNYDEKNKIEISYPVSLKKSDVQYFKFDIINKDTWKTLIDISTGDYDIEIYGEKLKKLDLDSKNDDIIYVYDFKSKKYKVQNDSLIQPIIINGGSNFEPNKNFLVIYDTKYADKTAKFLLSSNSSGQISSVVLYEEGEYKSVDTIGFFDITENELKGENWPNQGRDFVLRIKFIETNDEFISVKNKLWKIRQEEDYPFYEDYESSYKSVDNVDFRFIPNAGFVLENETNYSDFYINDILKPIDFENLETFTPDLLNNVPVFRPDETLWIYSSPGSNSYFNENYLGDWTVARVVDQNFKIHAYLESDPSFNCPLVVNSIPNDYVQYIGNGSNTTFLIPFIFYKNSDLVVLINGKILDNTNYNIVGNNIIFNTAPTNNARIEISRKGLWIYQTDGRFKGWTQVFYSGKFNFNRFVSIGEELKKDVNIADYVIVASGIECFRFGSLGQNYVPGDILTLSGGTLAPGGNPATFRVNNVYTTYVSSVSVLSGGSGYPPNQTFNNVRLIGGQGAEALVNVTTDAFGSVSTVSISGNNYGSYQVNPLGNICTLDLTPGSGAQILVTMQAYTYANTITLVNGGTGYSIDDVLEIVESSSYSLEQIRIAVTEVDQFGSITKFQIVSRGQFIPSTFLPQPLSTNVVAPPFSNGSGATFNVTYGNNPHVLRDIDIIFPGNYISVSTSVPYALTGGSGTGASVFVEIKEEGFLIGYEEKVKPGDWLVFISRKWQRTVPNLTDYIVIKASNLELEFFDPNILSNLVPIDFYTLREIKFDTYNDVLTNYVLPNNNSKAFVLNLNSFLNNNLNLWGVLRYNGTNWLLDRAQNKRVRHDRYISGFIYDKNQNIVISDVEYYDPYNGRLLSDIRENVDIFSDEDPAIYGQERNSWLYDKVGTIWWNLKEYRILDYEQSDSSYRRKNWGKPVKNSKIEVYEWIRSDLKPTEFKNRLESFTERDLFPGEPVFEDKFNESFEFDPIFNRSIKYYYFWVRKRQIVNDKKKLSIKQISDLINNPNISLKPWFAGISKDGMIIYEPGNVLSDDTIFQIIYTKNEKTKDYNNHTQWVLVPEKSDTFDIPKRLLNKLRDSLCGFDDYGEKKELFETKRKILDNVTILNSGSGYNNGNFIATVSGGTFIVPATLSVTVSGGQVVSCSILNPGLYLVPPPSPVSVTGIPGGSGALFNVLFLELNNQYDIWIPKLVPDENLSDVEKYGNLIRPRQTWFKNVCKARKEYVEVINYILGKLNLYKDRPNWDLGINQSEPYPFDINNPLPNQKVVSDSFDLYNKIITNQIVLNDIILMLGNQNTKGFWTLWKYEQSGLKLLDYQKYNTVDFYEIIDWYSPEVDKNNVPIIIYQDNLERDSKTDTSLLNKIVKVENDGSNKWAWYKLKINELNNFYWELVAREKSTIKLSSKFYENCGNIFGLFFNKNYNSFIYGLNWDEFDWDTFEWDPIKINVQNSMIGFGKEVDKRSGILELRILFEYLNNNVLDLSEINLMFFTMVRFAHTEHSYIDWAFKTSLVDVVGFNQELKQDAIIYFDISKSFLDFFDEAKPYHVKIKDFIKSFSFVDIANFYVTDFDKPVFFDIETKEYRVLSVFDPNDIKIFESPKNPGLFFNFLFLNLFLNNPRQSQSFIVSNVNQIVFTLPLDIIDASLVEVKVNNILKTINVDFYVSQNNIIFLYPLSIGDVVDVIERQIPKGLQGLVTSKNIWNDWYSNYLDNPELIRTLKIKILFDRLSCIDSNTQFFWDEFDWDTIVWDNAQTLVNPNITDTVFINLSNGVQIYDLSSIVQIDQILWHPYNFSEIYYIHNNNESLLQDDDYQLFYLDLYNFTGNGTNTTFSVNTKQNITPPVIQVFVNGVLQNYVTDYVLVGKNVVFNVPPPNNSIILVKILPRIILNFSPSTGSSLKIKRTLESMERILKYYINKEGKKSKIEKRLIPRCDFYGTVIEGEGFVKSFDWDMFDWDIPGSWDVSTISTLYFNDLILSGGQFYDSYDFTGDGSTLLFSLNPPPSVLPNTNTNSIVFINGVLQQPNIDYSFFGNSIVFTLPPPNNSEIKVIIAPFLPANTNIWDIVVDGYEFVSPLYGPNQPEERVKIKPRSPVIMKTFTEYSFGDFPIEIIRLEGNASSNFVEFKTYPQSIESIMVFYNENLILPPLWNLDYLNKRINFSFVPQNGEKIEVLIFNWAGTAKKIAQYSNFGTTSSKSFVYPSVISNVLSYVTLNGNLLSNVSSSVSSVVNNTTSWNVNLNATYTGLIDINSFDISNGEQVYLMRRDVFIANGGVQAFNISQNINLNGNYSQLFVFKNGKKISGPIMNFGIGDGINDVFPLSYPVINPSDVTVFVDNVLMVQGVDYEVGNIPPPPPPTNKTAIQFYPGSIPSPGQLVKIITNKNYHYQFFSPNQIIFNDPNNLLLPGDEIVVYSISNYGDSSIKKESFIGQNPAIYPLFQTPITPNHVNVYVNGKEKILGSDYLLNNDGLGWDLFFWDLFYTWDNSQYNILIFKDLHVESINFTGDGVTTNFSLSSFVDFPVESIDDYLTVYVNGILQENSVDYNIVFISPNFFVSFLTPPPNNSVITINSHAKVEAITWNDRIAKEPIYFLCFSETSNKEKNPKDWVYYRIDEDQRMNLRVSLLPNNNIILINGNKNIPIQWRDNNVIDQGYSLDTFGNKKYNPGLILVGEELISYEKFDYDTINDVYILEDLVRSKYQTAFGIEYKTISASYAGNGNQTIFATPSSSFFKVFVEIIEFEYDSYANDFKPKKIKTLRENIDYTVATNTIIFTNPPPLPQSVSYPVNIIVTCLIYDWTNYNSSHLGGTEVIALPEKSRFKEQFTINWADNKGLQYNDTSLTKFLLENKVFII